MAYRPVHIILKIIGKSDYSENNRWCEVHFSITELFQ